MTPSILMYHEVEPSSKVDKHYTLSESAFARQLEWLKRRGFASSLLDPDWSVAAFAAEDGQRRVALTFDDSHVNHYANSLPLLQRHGFTATFFVVTNHIGQDPTWLSHDQLGALARAGMSIQSHTHTHRFLDGLDAASLRDELIRSKHMIEDWLGLPVRHLSCPGGRYSRRVLDEAQTAGYLSVSTSVPGLAGDGAAREIAVLPRFLISGGTTMAQFERAANAEPAYVRRCRLGYTARRVAKRCLGDRLYQRIWQSVFRSDDQRTPVATET